MSKYNFTLLFISISVFLFAQQEKSPFIGKHLIRADVSFLSGYMMKEDMKNVHLSGDAEYYLDNTISIRGTATYLLGSSGPGGNVVKLNDFHSVMLGAALHFPVKSHFDPYVILQPGIAYTSSSQTIKVNDEVQSTVSYRGALTPLATAGIGVNYYFQRFAHLFVEGRYVYGRHLSEAPQSVSLEELRITFGLGFNLFIMKEKKESRG